MFAIFKKEFSTFFSTPTGYVVLGLYQIVMGLFLWVIPGDWNVFDSGYAQLDALFQLAPWVFMLLCPAITMRMISEEKQSHTWDLLMTKPISATGLVMGKYLAAVLLAVIALLPSLLYFWTISTLAEPAGNVDGGAFWGAMLGLLFSVLLNTAVGLFASSLTKSQIVSFMIALVLCFVLFYGFDLLSSFFDNGVVVNGIQQVGFHAHYTSISRGVIDTRDLSYFLGATAVFILSTIGLVSKR